ncbi:MAG: SDR family oxidoreductase [Actinobacteria bacterium]|nr:SDR family oxidoreductase [Actinomycetota bacterium]
MPEEALRGKIALVTGAASGLGRAVATALARADAIVVAADIDEDGGRAVAEELGVDFVRLDVADLDDNKSAVEFVVQRHGGLDIAHLNAGIASPFGLGDDFDLEGYRRAMGINLDGVVFGFHAARPAMLARGGGSVVATASLAGLTAMPPQPVYGINKHAVVGLVRALGPAHAHEGVRVNGICPGFADSKIIDPIREGLRAGGVPVIPAPVVADATLRLIADPEAAGELLVIQAGVDPYYFKFRGLPGAR